MLTLLLLAAAILSPGVAGVRAVMAGVETAHRAGRLQTEHRVSVSAQTDFLEITCDRWRDSSGTVRRLTYAGGSSDSFTTLAQTYDAAGRLRFVFWRGGAVNQAHKEIRLYFSASGQKVHETVQETGPGYPFQDPAERLIFTAKAAGKAPC